MMQEGVLNRSPTTSGIIQQRPGLLGGLGRKNIDIWRKKWVGFYSLVDKVEWDYYLEYTINELTIRHL